MADLELQMKSIQEKLQLLLRQQAHLQKENQRLKKDLEKALGHHSEKEQLILNLEQKLATIQLGAGNLNEAEKTALGKRIDSYLKEIDKCMALLNT
jgi:predicted membrane chloride channel (bestrophin family)